MKESSGDLLVDSVDEVDWGDIEGTDDTACVTGTDWVEDWVDNNDGAADDALSLRVMEMMLNSPGTVRSRMVRPASVWETSTATMETSPRPKL